MKFGFLVAVATSALSAADAATKVSVIELGKGGTVHRTDESSFANVAGVSSFWSALHSPGRKLQHAGMPVVPDLFSKTSDGMVLALKASDLEVMPFVTSLLSEEGSNGVVAHLEIDGNKADALLNKVRDADTVDSSMFTSSCKRHAASPGLTGMMTEVTGEKSADIDGQLREVIKSLNHEATAAGKTIVLHLVVEGEDSVGHRRLLSRRLEDEGEEQNEDADQDADGDNANGQNNNNGYYGYGYYNSYGEWVTPYKTMFQIQYFNVVLWTAIGLTMILFSTIYLMVYMPLMPDTLLFGESAKLMGDD